MNEDAMNNTVLANIPNWVRWCVFLPIAAFATYLVSNIIGIITEVIGTRDQGWSGALHMGIVALTFIFSASLIAPRHQKTISIVIGATGVFFTLFALFIALVTEGSEIVRWNMYIPVAIAILICSIIAPITIQKMLGRK